MRGLALRRDWVSFLQSSQYCMCIPPAGLDTFGWSLIDRAGSASAGHSGMR